MCTQVRCFQDTGRVVAVVVWASRHAQRFGKLIADINSLVNNSLNLMNKFPAD